MALVVGVDSSTQSCKVEIRDAETARVVASGSAPHPRTTPPVSEQHPKQWWQAFVAAFEQAKAGVDPSQIGAIAVAAQCHGLVLLDGSGAVLRPAKLWNDLTSAPQAEAMVTAAGAPFWADAVGSVPNAAFTISKLAWVAEHEPEILARAASACLPHDWLTWKLSGRLVTDRSEASGTGYYSARESAYRRDILGEFGRVSAELALPEVLGPDTAVGLIDPATARELGLGAGVLVGPGAGDQH
ncbi:MAG: xylulose kinase, partial [Propionibacteriaceae bacterium]|nr:xylulose kinase [Propionibacteriaceae bacterium]